MWSIQIKGDSWKDFVTKIKSEDAAKQMLPRLIAQFIMSPSSYRIVSPEGQVITCAN